MFARATLVGLWLLSHSAAKKDHRQIRFGHLIDDDSKEQNTLAEADLHIGKSRRILHTV